MAVISFDANKGLPSMTTKTPEEIVSDFVSNHAIVDKHLAIAFKAAQRMAEDVEAGIKAGLSTQLEAKSFLAAHRAAAGEIAAVAYNFADLHITGTEIAKRNGVDLGRLTSVGGVQLPEPEVSVMDGGR